MYSRRFRAELLVLACFGVVPSCGGVRAAPDLAVPGPSNSSPGHLQTAQVSVLTDPVKAWGREKPTEPGQVTDRVATVTLAAPPAVAHAGEFVLSVGLELADGALPAGALAVQVSFDTTLVKLDRDVMPSLAALGVWLANDIQGWVRVALSDPSGLKQGRVATFPFKASGPSGTTVEFTMEILQVVTAHTYEDISAQVIANGAETRIR
jgi:hypothetical protein